MVFVTTSPKTFKPFLYCGLNNGDLQLWAINSENSNLFTKLREMEVHRKGVKVKATGSQHTTYIFCLVTMNVTTAFV